MEGSSAALTHYNKRRYGAIINIKYNVNCQNPYSGSYPRELCIHILKHFTILLVTRLGSSGVWSRKPKERE